jgi:hypothetical protein
MSTYLRPAPSILFGFLPLPGLARRANASVSKRLARRIEPRIEPRVEPAPPTGRGTYPQPKALPECIDAGGGCKVPVDALLAKARLAPSLALIEWDGDRRRAAAPLANGIAPADAIDEEDPCTYDARRRRIRDRYIGARFPGVARCGADLESVDRVIKAARLYFEEEQAHSALELLDLAIQETPHASPLRLARLEILFLTRASAGFIAAARSFRAAHPGNEAWDEIARLGRSIAPDEPLFGSASAPRDHEHYGPWPHLPNWIQAPWDLTAEVTAADFHRAIQRDSDTPRG